MKIFFLLLLIQLIINISESEKCSFSVSPANDKKMISFSENELRSHISPFLKNFVQTTFPVTEETKKKRDIGLILRNGIGCLDSRIDEPVPTLEGGDLGTFIFGLEIAEELGKKWTQSEVDMALINYISVYKDLFSFCISREVLDRLCRMTGHCFSVYQLSSPPKQLFDALETLLVQPMYIADDLLKYMISFPDRFPWVQKHIPEMALRSVYRILWGTATQPQEQQQQQQQQLDIKNQLGIQSIIRSKIDILILSGIQNDMNLVEFSSPTCEVESDTKGQKKLTTMIVSPSSASSHFRFRYPNLAFELQKQVANFLLHFNYINLELLLKSDEIKSKTLRCVDGNGGKSKEGALCYFPFKLEGKTYYDCVPSDKSTFGWCATEEAWESSQNWGNCKPAGAKCGDEADLKKFSNDDARDYISNRISKISENVIEAFLEELTTDNIGSSNSNNFAHYNVLFDSDCCPKNHKFLNTENNLHSTLKVPEDSQIYQKKVCAPNEIKIVVDQSKSSPNIHYSLNSLMPIELRELHFDLDEFKPITFSSIKYAPILAMDGRHPEQALQTPGGGVGELSLLLSIYSSLSPANEVSQTDVDKILSEYLVKMSSKSFTYTIDSKTINIMFAAVAQPNTKSLKILKLMTQIQRKKQILSILVNPPVEMRQTLIKILSSTSVLSDDYLRFIVERKTQKISNRDEVLIYKMRKILPMVITSFFKLLWQPNEPSIDKPFTFVKEKLDLIVIEQSSHHEQAVVRINSTTCHNSEFLPTLKSQNLHNYPATSVIIYHERAADFMRKEMIDVMNTFFGEDTLPTDKLIETTNSFVNSQFNSMISEKYPNIPVYDLIFDCCP